MSCRDSSCFKRTLAPYEKAAASCRACSCIAWWNNRRLDTCQLSSLLTKPISLKTPCRHVDMPNRRLAEGEVVKPSAMCRRMAQQLGVPLHVRPAGIRQSSEHLSPLSLLAPSGLGSELRPHQRQILQCSVAHRHWRYQRGCLMSTPTIKLPHTMIATLAW